MWPWPRMASALSMFDIIKSGSYRLDQNQLSLHLAKLYQISGLVEQRPKDHRRAEKKKDLGAHVRIMVILRKSTLKY